MAGKSILQASGAGVSVRAACHQHLSWSRWGDHKAASLRPQSHARGTDTTQQTLLPPKKLFFLLCLPCGRTRGEGP